MKSRGTFGWNPSQPTPVFALYNLDAFSMSPSFNLGDASSHSFNSSFLHGLFCIFCISSLHCQCFAHSFLFVSPRSVLLSSTSLAFVTTSAAALSDLHRNVISSFLTNYVKVLQLRSFSALRHFFFFDGATWSQLDLFLSHKVSLNCFLWLRSCDLSLEVALGRFLPLFVRSTGNNNTLCRSLCANMLHIRAKCRSDVLLSPLSRSCLSKDQRNIWSYVLGVRSKKVFPLRKMDGFVMEGRTRSMCIMLQDVFGRNRL